MANRLAGGASPYLLQHAENPVLLSVGYSAGAPVSAERTRRSSISGVGLE